MDMRIQDFKTELNTLNNLSKLHITSGGYLNPCEWHITPSAFFDMFDVGDCDIDAERDRYSQISAHAYGVKVFCLVHYEEEEKDGWFRKIPDVPEWWKNGEEKPGSTAP